MLSQILYDKTEDVGKTSQLLKVKIISCIVNWLGGQTTKNNGKFFLMDSTQDKDLAKSRSLILGLLERCNFFEGPNADCPLSEMRHSANDAEKYEYVMGLYDEEISAILKYHDKCYKKRMPSVTSS